MKHIQAIIAGLIAAIVLAAAIPAKASTPLSEDPFEGSLSVGVNSDGYETSLGIAYIPIKYAGIKLDLGLASEFSSLNNLYWDYDTGLGLEGDENRKMRIQLRTSVVLRSPVIIPFNKEGTGILLQAEPGFIITNANGTVHIDTPAGWENYHNHGGRYVYWQMRAGISIQLGSPIITLGYGITNFELYNDVRHVVVDGAPYYSSGRSRTHSGFLTIALPFSI